MHAKWHRVITAIFKACSLLTEEIAPHKTGTCTCKLGLVHFVGGKASAARERLKPLDETLINPIGSFPSKANDGNRQ